jgi:hypothetical protein
MVYEFKDLTLDSVPEILLFQNSIRELETPNSYDYMTYGSDKFNHLFKTGGCLGIFNNSQVGFGTYNTTGLEHKFKTVMNDKLKSENFNSIGYIAFILIEQQARGLGLQKQIIEKLEDKFIQSNLSKSIICVNDGNPISKQNILSCGYEFHSPLKLSSGEFIINLYEKQI